MGKIPLFWSRATVCAQSPKCAFRLNMKRKSEALRLHANKQEQICPTCQFRWILHDFTWAAGARAGKQQSLTNDLSSEVHSRAFSSIIQWRRPSCRKLDKALSGSLSLGYLVRLIVAKGQERTCMLKTGFEATQSLTCCARTHMHTHTLFKARKCALGWDVFVKLVFLLRIVWKSSESMVKITVTTVHSRVTHKAVQHLRFLNDSGIIAFERGTETHWGDFFFLLFWGDVWSWVFLPRQWNAVIISLTVVTRSIKFNSKSNMKIWSWIR